MPTYSATLNDLGIATPGTAVLLSTGPIALRGSFNSPNNRALLDMRMAVAPQSFGIGNFSATVTLTITSP